jgi:REP element-mobilizing transposase RayT
LEDDRQGETLPSRKHPAHPPVVEAFNRSVIIFVTVCTKDRHCVLANAFMHELLRRAWESADRWTVGRYVVMPDHTHLFCAPGTWPPTSIKKWVEYWKGCVSRELKGHGPLAEYGRGETRPSTPDSLWQRDCWDTQLRRGESYHAKWEYVRFNPVRADLCGLPNDWPYQGEMNVLQWHD